MNCREKQTNLKNVTKSVSAVFVTVAPSILVLPAVNATTSPGTVAPAQATVLPSTPEVPMVNRTPVVRTTPSVTLPPIPGITAKPVATPKPGVTAKPIVTPMPVVTAKPIVTPNPVAPSKPSTPKPKAPQFSATSKSDTASAPYRLVSISEIPYKSHTKNIITYIGNHPVFFQHNSMDSIIQRNGKGELTINIDASFTQSRYFVVPNIKGLCNRLQIFAGLYIISSYFRIPIILSKSMGWKQVWNMKEMFRGQLIEVPDRGRIFAIP